MNPRLEEDIHEFFKVVEDDDKVFDDYLEAKEAIDVDPNQRNPPDSN